MKRSRHADNNPKIHQVACEKQDKESQEEILGTKNEKGLNPNAIADNQTLVPQVSTTISLAEK